MSVAGPIANPPANLRQRRRKSGWRIWWEPNARARELGFEPRELDASRLTWSVREAENLNALVDETTGPKPARKPARGRNTLHDLIGRYRASPRWHALSPKSRDSYAKVFNLIDRKWGAHRVADLTRPLIVNWYETLFASTSTATASSYIRHLSILLSYAEDLGWITINPCVRLRLVTPARRSRIVTWAEYDALMTAAAQYPSMACAIAMARLQGQRQTDILTARTDAFRDGIWRLIRSKRHTAGAIGIHPDLLPHLQPILERAGSRELLLHYERTGAPYTVDLFQTVFARVRRAAAEIEPGCASMQFRDLRRTFASTARAAGVERLDIGNALGNKVGSDAELDATYLPPDTTAANRAIAAQQRPKG